MMKAIPIALKFLEQSQTERRELGTRCHTHGTNAWYFGGTSLYFTTTDRIEATPSPMAV